MGLGILLGAVSLWVLKIAMKDIKFPSKRFTIGITYTIGKVA
jgi:hypothetical protein